MSDRERILSEARDETERRIWEAMFMLTDLAALPSERDPAQDEYCKRLVKRGRWAEAMLYRGRP